MNISFSYGERKILEDVCFSMKRGERVVLYGKNGSGKSTFARILAGVEIPGSGFVSVDDSRIDPESSSEHRKSIGLMLQNPSDTILTTQVARELAFPLEFLAIEPATIHDRIRQIAEEFDLDLEKSPQELSGGMIARLALATTVIADPDFIVLDEPTTYLDFEGRKLFFNSLDRMRDKGILLITQNPAFCDWADKVLVMEEGRLKERIAGKRNIPGRLNGQSGKTILQANGIEFSYETNKVLYGVDVTIRSASCTAILGRSGSGKSTLLYLLAGLFKADRGEVQSDCYAGMIFQFPGMQLFDKTVLDDVAFGPRNFKMKSPYQLAEKALETVNLSKELYTRNPFTLSEGEKRRAGIAGVIATNPEILILDEPTATLDEDGIEKLCKLINKYRTEDKAAVIVSHEIDFIRQVCDYAIVLDDGKIVFSGEIEDLFRHDISKWGLGLIYQPDD